MKEVEPAEAQPFEVRVVGFNAYFRARTPDADLGLVHLIVANPTVPGLDPGIDLNGGPIPRCDRHAPIVRVDGQPAGGIEIHRLVDLPDLRYLRPDRSRNRRNDEG